MALKRLFFVLFVCFSVGFSQQKKLVNGWYLGGIYSSWTDSLMTKTVINPEGQTFSSYGATSFPVKQWTIQTTWIKFFSPFITPDSISIDCKLVKGTANIKAVAVYIAVQDSIGSYYFLGDTRTILLNSTWKTFGWNMSRVKNFGIRSFNKFYLAYQFVASDSCYIGGDITVKNLKGIDDTLGTFYIDFDSNMKVSSFIQTPSGFALEQNYPNPFNPSTTIRFSVPQREYVSLIVFNSLGQEIQTLVSEEKQSGIYEVKFDAFNLPSGVYFYKLQTGSFVETKKMFFLK